MNEIQETARTTGSIVLAEMYVVILVTIAVVSIKKAFNNFKKDREKIKYAKPKNNQRNKK